MSLLIEVLIVGIYGGSALIVGGAALAWKLSYRFRASLVGDHAAR